jgi:hypothetical protein
VADGAHVYSLTTAVAERKRISLRRDDQARFNQALMPGQRIGRVWVPEVGHRS